MASFNYSTMQMTAKVVYYGPGLCGKTTSLQYIYDHTAGNSRGQMLSLETQTDRTLFFDLLPLEVGTIAGFATRIQLYTVPGQVFYNTTRKLVLKGVDGVVFVADSQRPMLPANVESFKNLQANLAELGILIGAIPFVLQYNKRDLPDVCSLEELDQLLNRLGVPRLEASAISGVGIFETLRAISKETLRALKKQLEEGSVEVPAAVAAKRATESPVAARLARGGSHAAPANLAVAALPGQPTIPSATGEAARVSAATAVAAEQPARSVLLNLARPDYERARRVTFNLRVEDADRQTVREIRDVSMDIDPEASPKEMLVQLRLRLGHED